MPCCDEISFIFHDGASVDLVFNIILIVRLRLARFRLFLHHGLFVRAATLIVGAVLRIFIALTISGHLCQVAGLSNYVTRNIVHLLFGRYRPGVCEVRSLGGNDISFDDGVYLGDGCLVLFNHRLKLRLRLLFRFWLLFRLRLLSRLRLFLYNWLRFQWLARLLFFIGLFIRFITNPRIRVRSWDAAATLLATSIRQSRANAVQFLPAASVFEN